MAIRKVNYATWPENQVMLECKHARSVNDTEIGAGTVCTKDGKCYCLHYQKVSEKDKLEIDENGT